MTRRIPRRVAVVAALLAAAGGAAAAPGSVATAATGGRWSQLSSGPGVAVSNAPGVTRFGDKLVVAWTQASGGTSSLKTRLVGADALPAGPESVALAGWASLSSDPAVFLHWGKPVVAFGGLRSLDSTDPRNGPVSVVESQDGIAWGLGAGTMSQTRLAYGDYGIGAVEDKYGVPVVALAAGSSDHVTVHYGINVPGQPVVADTFSDPTGEAQQVGVASSSATGETWAAWYSSSSGTFNGIHAQRVTPTIGPRSAAPLSSVPYAGEPTSVNPGQNVAMTQQLGNGNPVWAAYGSGYPSRHRLVLWRVGTAQTLVVPRAGAIQYVGISAATGGRLWVWWVEGNAVYAARTNPAVTQLGVVRRVVAPGGASPTRTAGDGSTALRALDVVVNAQPGDGPPGIYSTRIVEQLRVRVAPGRVSPGDQVTVRVTDAGVAVRDAAVRVGGVVKHTDARGRATFRVPTGAARGLRTVVASARYFVAGRATFRVVS